MNIFGRIDHIAFCNGFKITKLAHIGWSNISDTQIIMHFMLHIIFLKARSHRYTI